MTFIEKLRNSIVNGAGVGTFCYHAAGDLNAILSGVEIGDDVIAFCYLLGGGDVAVGKQSRESVQVAVFFCKKTEFDFNSFENEQLIDDCKRVAFGWLGTLLRSPYLEIDGAVSTQRVYDTTTDILTGIAINIALREVEGYGLCDMPEKIFTVSKNGIYCVAGYDKVLVDVDVNAADYDGTEYPDTHDGMYFDANGVRKTQNREIEQKIIVNVH